MTLKRFFILPSLAVLASSLAIKVSTADMDVSEERLREYVKSLSHDIGERNVFNYQNLLKAENYIAEKFKSLGYEPELEKYELAGKICRNIIATKKGISRPDEILIIGAHYDSVWGTPGADDNASGVAAILELADLFSKSSPGRTVRFIAFVNEEPPFFLTQDMGSMRYAREARRRRENIIGMICLESIGYYSKAKGSQSYPYGLRLWYPDRGDFLTVVGDLRSAAFAMKVAEIFKRSSSLPVRLFVGISIIVPAIDFSDNHSFWHFGYKAVMITDTAFYRNPNYHSVSDTFDTVDYKSLAEAVKGLYRVLAELIE